MTSSISFPLKDLFPRENYPPEDKKLIPHYLIAQGQPIETIQRVLRRPDACINYEYMPYRLTPLAVAALAQSRELVDWLLNEQANPLPRDQIGWTPLHYAEILGDDEMKTKLIAKAKKIRECVIPSLSELKRVLRRGGQGEMIDGARLFDPWGRVSSPLTSEKFRDLFGGAAFCPEVTATRESLIQYWAESPPLCKKNAGLVDFLTRSFERQRSTPLLMGIIPQRGGFHQVITRENISLRAGVLGIYGGEIGQSCYHSSFQLGPINSRWHANLFSCIPDGMPNCYTDLIQAAGFPYFPVLAFEEIPAGAPLYLDYGALHPAKHRYRPVPKETIDYYRKFSLTRAIDTLQEFDAKEEDFCIVYHLRFQKTWGRFSYLFDTPFLLIELLYLEVLDPQTVINAIETQVLPIPEPKNSPFERTLNCWPRNQLILEIWRLLKAHTLSPLIIEKTYLFIKTVHIDTATYFLIQLETRLSEIQTEDDLVTIFCELRKNCQAYKSYLKWFETRDATQEESLFQEAEVALSSVSKRDVYPFLETAFKLLALRKGSSKIFGFLTLGAWIGLKAWVETWQTQEYKKYNRYLEGLTLEELVIFHETYRSRFEHFVKEKDPNNAAGWLERFDNLFTRKLPAQLKEKERLSSQPIASAL